MTDRTLYRSARDCLAAVDDPVARSFLADLPADPPASPEQPRPHPGFDFLDRLPDLAAPSCRDLVEALVAEAGRLCWRQSYRAEDFGAGFVAGQGWVQLLGADGPLVDRLGLVSAMVLGPHLRYPRHSHAAEELYLVLAGRVLWEHDDEPGAWRTAGQIIHHRPHVVHALETGPEPCLMLAIWRGAGYQKSRIHEGAPDMSETDDDARHAQKMAKKKAARDKIMAGKTDQKGLIIVHTGKGKGKSTAGFGMIFRCIAHGMPSAVVQFIKGGMKTGERDLIESRFADICQFHTMGEGFTWETQDRARDTQMARAAWEKAKELIRDKRNRMVLLDEINIAIRYDYVPVDEVVAFLRDEKPEMTHVVCTGRNAKDELIEIADMVTEMELVKHPFRSGIKAQQGVEF